MSDALSPSRPAPEPVRFGFHGKLPSRGDFVGAHLSAAFRDAFHAWIAAVLPQARDALGTDWEPCWMVAPVWRFRLPPGQFGPFPCVGLWMPSVDRAGRCFPLLAAAEGVTDAPSTVLDRVESLARQALAGDEGPDPLAAALAGCVLSGPALDAGFPRAACWSTEGGPRRPPGNLSPAFLPDALEFQDMLRA